tara:strand:+ start:7253 stop:7564 length:312 start_codon:yes stop_codon:yes gene_type:complete
MNKSISWNKINLKEEKKEEKKQYDDSRFIKLLQELEDIKFNEKKIKFNNWVNKTNIDNIKYNVIINHFYKDLKNIIINSNFTITNEKQLRNELATFIYSVSRK